MRTLSFTLFALVAFATNSLLCRLALGRGGIDAISFSAVRLVTGAAALAVISLSAGKGLPLGWRSRWPSAILLFAYAACFSLAYVGLAAGTGALILFAAVQGTMIAAALRAGERPHPPEWLGLLLALAGLVWLVFPGLHAPPPLSSLLMATSGVAWGLYSLRGRGSCEPLRDTAGNFACSLPFALLLSAAASSSIRLTLRGVLLATASGALASGVGYVVWYAALRGLTATRAATVQLAVPVLAAAGGVILLAEPLTPRLAVSAFLILGGIGVALVGRERYRRGEAGTTR